MGMEDMLKAILGAAEASQAGAARSQSQGAGQAGDPLAEILSGLLGGAGQQSGAGGLGDILGGAGQESGAAGGQRSQQSSAGGLGDILGSILGGAGQESSMPQQGGTGGAAGAGGLGDILGSILGGGAGAPSSSTSTTGLESLFAPLISGLAAKLGLPPAIAQAVVGFVLSKLLSGQSATRQQTQPAQGGGLNLDGLLEQMRSDQGVSPSYLKRTGMTKELAKQTGLDPKTAAQSLQHVFDMLGGRSPMGEAAAPAVEPPSDQGSGLDGLLQKW